MTALAFQLVSPYEPTGDQPQAIGELLRGLESGVAHQVLLGATGTGKTFTVANVIARMNRPTLVLAPNKTLAAQLYTELKQFFPHNAVEYFVSYYDYFQPEAYIPSTDTFIEKDAMINEAIDRMRHAATRAVIERRDVIIVASVSCIYGIGDKETYRDMLVRVEAKTSVRRDRLLRQLVDIQYQRNDYDFHRGTFRVRGDVIEVFPAYEEDRAVRIEMWGDEVESIAVIDPLRGTILERLDVVEIFPGSHYVTPAAQLERAAGAIKAELDERLAELRAEGKELEAQRLGQRTLYDLEMLSQVGFCYGIENYSRHLTGAAPGDPPPVLIDYFPRDFLMIIDESHVTVPQIGGMFRGDRARKQTLVDFGFRLPSALDNRPLKFDEFEARAPTVIYLSATPGDYELERAGGVVVEQIIRPTGLVDPLVDIRPVSNQVDDLLGEIRARVARGHRVLVTTLTKRMAEDLTEYYRELGVKVRYLHSDIDTLERVELLDELRRGTFDVLVGINLLREGLDLPEVGLVAILDADKEGFLRSARSLIQTIGRAARNVEGAVILYADRVTDSMKKALDETERRRERQLAHNEAHGIVPESTVRTLKSLDAPEAEPSEMREKRLTPAQAQKKITALKKEMNAAAKALEYERAANLRDQIRAYEAIALGVD